MEIKIITIMALGWIYLDTPFFLRAYCLMTFHPHRICANTVNTGQRRSWEVRKSKERCNVDSSHVIMKSTEYLPAIHVTFKPDCMREKQKTRWDILFFLMSVSHVSWFPDTPQTVCILKKIKGVFISPQNTFTKCRENVRSRSKTPIQWWW